MTKKLILAIIALMLIIVSSTGTVFAWFKLGDNINNFSFKIAKLDSTISLYKAEDYNLNGIPDIDDSGKYVYTFIGSQNAVTTSSTADISMNISIVNMMPTQVHTYKVSVNNKSEAKNELRFVFEEYDNINNYSKYLKMLSVKTGLINSDGSVNYSEKRFFANSVSTVSDIEHFSEMTVEEGVDIMGIAYAQNNENQRDFWLQFEFETYDSLEANITDVNNKFTKEEYQAIQSKNIILPLLRIYMEIK